MNPDPETPHVSFLVKYRRWLIFAALAAALFAAGLFAAPSGYRYFKRWRSRHLAAQAERWLSQNEWGKAMEKAQAAFVLGRSEPAALRAMARVLTRATNAAALQFWQYLSLSGQAASQDRQACAELAIRLGSPSHAAAELQKLLAEAPNDPVNLWLASQLYAALGDFSQTVYYATRARLHAPANRQYQLFLSSLLFDASAPESRAEARNTVWTLAREPDQLGLEALRFLALRQDLVSTQRQELITLLQQHPAAGTPRQLLILDQRLRLEPSRRDEILDQALAQYRNSDPETLAQFLIWLNQRGEFQRTLAAVPLDQALKRKDLFVPHVDALASLGRWEELDQILGAGNAPLEQVYSEAFRARCATRLDKPFLADVCWKRALAAAERNPDALGWLAQYALKCGDLEHAGKTYRALIACTAFPQPAYRALVAITSKTGTTTELRDLIGEMLKRWPDDYTLRNDFAYLNALLAQQLSEAQLTAEELVSQFPDSFPFRTTLALARLRSQDAAAALRVYVGRLYDWHLTLPGNRAVYAAVLAANGQAVEARNLARSIPAETLRQEELDLLASIQ